VLNGYPAPETSTRRYRSTPISPRSWARPAPWSGPPWGSSSRTDLTSDYLATTAPASSLTGWPAGTSTTSLPTHPSTTCTVYRANTYELEMRDSHCHQATEDATGQRVPCRGQVVGILKPDGSKVVQCDVDPLHFMPADQWFQGQARRSPRPSRAINTLKKKYAFKRSHDA